jgi:hypothetical protein
VAEDMPPAFPEMLPAPGGNSLAVVWYIVLITLSIVVIGGMLIIWSLTSDGLSTEVFVGFVGAALGALIGLIAPSPVGNG